MAPRGPARGTARHVSIPWLIESHAVTHVQCTPTFARMLVAEEESRSALARLHAFVVGGEALPPDLARALVEARPRSVWNMYGPTETTVWSTAARVGGPCRGAA